MITFKRQYLVTKSVLGVTLSAEEVPLECTVLVQSVQVSPTGALEAHYTVTIQDRLVDSGTLIFTATGNLIEGAYGALLSMFREYPDVQDAEYSRAPVKG